MDSILSTFHVEWKLLLAQAVNFGVVFFVLYRYLIKPIQKNADERSKEISKGLDDAKDYKELLEKSEKDYQVKMSEARKEIATLTNKLKKQAEEEKSEILAEAKVKSLEIIKKTEQDIDAKKKEIINDAKTEISQLVINLSQKLMQDKITSVKNDSLVDEIAKQI